MSIAKLISRLRREHGFIFAHDRVDDPQERLRRCLVVPAIGPFRNIIGGVVGSGLPLNDFQAIPKWISKLEPIKSRDCNALKNLQAVVVENRSPVHQIVHFKGEVRLECLALDTVLGPDMYLVLAYTQPESAAMAQSLGLRDLLEL